MIQYITSKENATLKSFKKLKKSSVRREMGIFLAEGKRIVKEALTYNLVDTLILHESVELEDLGSEDELCKIPIYFVNDMCLEQITDTKNSQGVLALCKIVEKELVGDKILICDNIKDPGNLGTLIRTAEGAGFLSVGLYGNCVDLYNEKVVRATMGSIFRLPISRVEISDIENLRKKGYEMAVTTLEGSVDLYHSKFSSKIILVIGSESHGASKQLVEMGDLRIKIPMAGEVESLNAAISGAIAMYEISRAQNL